ncbi:TIGR03915 family putative DNA repair protein [Geobacter sp.]|uniref:TIGR03915 family putative DNA repair protein n=1 Tax=Geobacter sp. TaxID=46610 RepID=UPI0027BABAB3|nr:TIGR03915 family putative DNA repair protein [Geobacter sp.]
MILRYDGTFAGFLSAVALARDRSVQPEAITDREPDQQGLFAEVEEVATDRERAADLYRLIRSTLPPGALQTLRYAFHASDPDRGTLLFRYLMLGLTTEPQFGAMLAHEAVMPVWKLARAVGRETHRYKGLVRFQQLEGDVWYAAMEPDHRILPLIAPHFAARFADQRWIIHDPRRGEAVVFDPARRKWAETFLEVTAPLPLTAGEELFRDLWQRYFDRLAIEERRNPKLQRQNLPLKHRRHLPEFDGK